MTCISNSCCHLNWPCEKPAVVMGGLALCVTAFAVALLTVLVAKGMVGKAQIGVAGSVVLTFITLTIATAGGVLIGVGTPKKPQMLQPD